MTLSSSPQSAPPAPARPDITQRRLLQSIAEVARSVFAAAAASVFVVDRSDGTLVFEAVCGEGEEHLVGARFPGGTGIAGWVATFGQPLLVDDVADSPQFARRAAESTGYVPRSIMAAPLIWQGEAIGVLEVLDKGTRPRGDLGDVGLIGLLATEVATALELLTQLRWSAGSAGGAEPAADSADVTLMQRVAQRLPGAAGPVAATVRRLLATADDLLSGDAGPGHG
jgi:GAF domain-containing protein